VIDSGLLTRGRGSEAISPTAHYTGYVWARNGLSHPELPSREGRLLFELLRPTMVASRLLGGPTLEAYLLARHRAIDHLLTQAIEERGATQVIEVACGLSPRGWRFTNRYGDRLTYIEADLPDMAARKRQALERMGSLSERHRVEELDALRDDGPASLAAIAADLDPEQPLVIVTEGLLSYFETDQVLGVWRRFAEVLSGFQGGRYISDLHLSGDARAPHVRAFRAILSAFVRGPVRLHFTDLEEATAALREAGFSEATVHRSDSNLVRIIDARVT
jgi:O-methyltransferase involved in polyketide biosynthesis